MSTDDVDQFLEEHGLTIRVTRGPSFTVEDELGQLVVDAPYLEALDALSEITDVADADAILSAAVDGRLAA